MKCFLRLLLLLFCFILSVKRTHLCDGKVAEFGKLQLFIWCFSSVVVFSMMIVKSVTRFQNSIFIVNCCVFVCFLFRLVLNFDPFILFTCDTDFTNNLFCIEFLRLARSTKYIANGKQLYWCQFDLKPLWQCEDIFTRISMLLLLSVIQNHKEREKNNSSTLLDFVNVLNEIKLALTYN